MEVVVGDVVVRWGSDDGFEEGRGPPAIPYVPYAFSVRP
jgi:hypothetical protein